MDSKKNYYTPATKKAAEKYISNNYDRLYIRLRRDDSVLNKAYLQEVANREGVSVNTLVGAGLLKVLQEIEQRNYSALEEYFKHKEK